MTYVFWAEKIILKKSHWNIQRIYPSEVTELIIKEILLKNSFPEKLINNYKEIVNTFILFSLNEYSIYKKYNQIIIALTCGLIGISYPSEFSEKFKKEDLIKYKQLIYNEIYELNFIENNNILNECEKDILNLLENNEEEEEEDNIDNKDILNLLENNEEEEEEDNIDNYISNALTRTNSTISFNETFSDYDKVKNNIYDLLYIRENKFEILSLESKESKSFLGKKTKD